MVAPVGGSTTDMAPVAAVRSTLSVRDELRELTHQRLLSAAQAMFERDGYARTTIGNIAKEANVNRATFYLHFADKVEILRAVLQANLAETPEYWHEVDAALVDGGHDALRASLSNTLTWYAQHGRLLASVREAVATEPQVRDQPDGTFARFADEMSGYLALVLPEQRESAHLRLQMLIIQLDQMAFRLIVRRIRDIDRERLLDELTDIWMLALPPAQRSS